MEGKLSLDALLQMTGAQVRDTMRRLGSSSEECARLIAALSCLNSATESGMCLLQTSVIKYIILYFPPFLPSWFKIVPFFVVSPDQEVNLEKMAVPGCLSPPGGTAAPY